MKPKLLCIQIDREVVEARCLRRGKRRRRPAADQIVLDSHTYRCFYQRQVKPKKDPD